MRLLALAILACALAGGASAEETRIITHEIRPIAGNNVAPNLEHTNGTAYFEPGGVGLAVRQGETDFFIYQHGIDLTDPTVTVSGGGGVTAKKVWSFGGGTSNVFLPIGLGDVRTPAGGLVVQVHVDRNVPLDARRTIRVAHISGDVVFDVEVTCKPSETAAKLTRTTLDKTGFAAGAQARLDLFLDLPAHCAGQRVTVQLPPCLEMANPVGGRRLSGDGGLAGLTQVAPGPLSGDGGLAGLTQVATVQVNGFDGQWEADDPKTLAFTLYGRDACPYQGGVNRGVFGYDVPGNIRVTLGGLTKTLAVNYHLPPLSTTLTPANPGPRIPPPRIPPPQP